MGDVLSSKIVKTRKPHYCAYCSQVINPGFRAAHWIYVDGGEFWNNYAHIACQTIVDNFDVYDTEEINDGYLQDTLDDLFDKIKKDYPGLSLKEYRELPVVKRAELIIEHYGILLYGCSKSLQQ